MAKPVKRIISGTLVVLAVVLAAFLMPSLGTCILLVTISSLALLEFYHLLELTGGKAFKWLGMFFGAMIIVLTWFARLPGNSVARDPEPLLLAVMIIVMFLRLIPQKNNGRPLETAACTVFGVLYVSVLFNYLTKLVFEWEPVGMLSRVGATGRLFFLYLLVVVKMADIGAYVVGSQLGRHKFIPRISPGKTLEGCAGAAAAGLVSSLIFFWICGGRLGVVEMKWLDAVVLGILLPFIGMAGDLGESMLKRAAGTKDSSIAVPGMGGVLDVLDSLLFAVPVLYLYAVYAL